MGLSAPFLPSTIINLSAAPLRDLAPTLSPTPPVVTLSMNPVDPSSMSLNDNQHSSYDEEHDIEQEKVAEVNAEEGGDNDMVRNSVFLV